MRQSHKTLLVWLMMGLASVAAYQLISSARLSEDKKPSFSDFMQEVEKNPSHIKTVKIDGQEFFITYNEAPPNDRAAHVAVG